MAIRSTRRINDTKIGSAFVPASLTEQSNGGLIDLHQVSMDRINSYRSSALIYLAGKLLSFAGF